MEIVTVGQCVLELILNALDVKTTGIAVRFDSDKKKIQVIDSGDGIPPDVFLRIGEIEKKNVNTRETCYTHSRKGESLKQIINLSQICTIISKHGETSTYEKVFKIGEDPTFIQSNLLNKGTVVTIYGYEGSGWESALHRIYFVVTSLALIYTDVSFTLQDEKADKLTVAISKPHEPYSILNIICRQTISLKTSWHLNSHNSSGFKICGYIGFLEMNSIFVRNIFINRRPANCLQIQKLILDTMKELGDELKISSMDNIYFVIFIQCSELDFLLSSYEGRTFVIFEEWSIFADIVKNCLLNTLRINSDNLIEPGSSSFTEAFQHYNYYKNKDEDYLEKTNNLLTRESINDFNFSNQFLDRRISIATQTSLPPSAQKFNHEKQSKTNKISHNRKKFPDKGLKIEKPFPKKGPYSKANGKKKKELLKLINDSQETLENPLKVKLKKLKPLQIQKKSLKDIFDRQISKSSTLNNPLIVNNVKKDTDKETKKTLIDRKLKVKKNSNLQKNDNSFKKPFGSHRITMTQLSLLQMKRRDKLREQKQKREVEKQILLKRKQESFLENQEKMNQLSDSEFESNERIIKKMKINNDQKIISPIKNHVINEKFFNNPKEEIIENQKLKEQFFLSRKNHEIVEKYLKNQEKRPNYFVSSEDEFFNQPRINEQILKNNQFNEQFFSNQRQKNEISYSNYFPEKKINNKSQQQINVSENKLNDNFMEQFLKNQKKPTVHSDLKVFFNDEIMKKMKTKQGEHVTLTQKNRDDFMKEFLRNQKKINTLSELKSNFEDEILKKLKSDVVKNIDDIVTKFWINKQQEMKNNCKICHEEKIINVDKLRKLNNCQTVIKHLRKNEKYYLDENIDNDNFKRSIINNQFQFERKNQNNYKKDQNSFLEKEEKQEENYNSMEKVIHQQQNKETNYFQHPENYHQSIKIFDKNDDEFLMNQKIVTNNNEQTSTISNQETVNQFVTEYCSQLSEWSDWNYVVPISKNYVQFSESKKIDNHRLYYFLPPIFNSMLRFGKSHILSDANIQNNVENVSTIFKPQIKPDQIVSRYQNLNVRLCIVPHRNEFKLNRKTLYSVEILRQINSEFIAALAVQDNSRLLLMIDQHAADERIRYEDLLQSYRIEKTKQYYSIVLDHPILINDMEEKNIKLLFLNEKLIAKFGIKLKFSSNNSLMVTNVPRCFLRRKSEYSEFKLFCSVKNLLTDIVESLETTNGISILPKSIHNSVASEACRGAIKFGDILTNDQCNLLIKSLRKAKAPNRCAHGRPSIFPLLDLTDLKKKQQKSHQNSFFLVIEKTKNYYNGI
ncbi:DNA mismatch repair protein Mlh3-like isoform X2 [Leptopilina boulardi]|uniref:DNA mismatch repair protein Mlh3-like isoform X2 n=1 Tax=Leptopilina boulardi TaxID=63433 RepID=UPI0021F64E73|nr:DNA mismatch repair protein Mlh3-like isoform X2 [Leptopilina boulardi]